MFTIFKKELRSYIRRGSAFFFLAASILFVAFQTLRYNFYYGYPNTEMALSGLSIVICLILPLFTMNIFSRDRHSQTEKLLFALPFKTGDIVFGKYLAALCFIGIDTLVLSIVPLIVGFFGEVNYLAAYLCILCFFLFCAAILALLTFIGAVMKNTVTTAILSYLSVFLSFVLYLVPTGAEEGIWYTIASILRFLSPFSHINGFVSGTFNIGSIVYLLLFTALFISLSLIATKRNKETIKYGKKSEALRRFALSPVLAILLCVCTVAVSTLSYFIPADLTSFNMNAMDLGNISESTKKFISSVESDVTIYIINPDDSDKQLEEFVNLYDKNSERIKVITTKAEDISQNLIALGWDGVTEIAPYTLLIESDKGEERTQVIDSSSLFYYDHPEFGQMDYNTYSYYYSLLSQYAASSEEYAEMLRSFIYDTKICTNIEQVLNESIEYAVVDIIPQPYFLIGHGEPEADSSTLREAFASFGFTFKDVDLTKSPSLPLDTSVIIINTPKTDISQEEATIISDFLKNGGSMSLITNEANLDMPNLMSLVNAYSVSSSKGLVAFDYEAEAEDTQGEGTAAESDETSQEVTETELPDKHLVEAVFNSSHEAFAQLDGYSAVVLRANHIDISNELDENVVVTPALTTGEKCFVDGVSDSEGQKTVAVTIETKNDDPTRIVWFTGADAFDGENMQAINAYGAIYSILWGVDIFESSLEEAEPKPITASMINASSNAVLICLVIFVVVIPSLITVAGIIMAVRFKKAPVKKKTETANDSEDSTDQNETQE